MKKGICFFTIIFSICFLASAYSDNVEKITMTLGSLKVIDLPFVMDNYRPSTRGIIRIENFTEKQLRIIAEKQGICELEVSGGGLTRLYSISVVDNISEILKQLQNDLDTLPELDISINQDYIVIRGDVSNIANWEHLQQVLENQRFKGCTQNYAKFRPAPEIMLNLRNLLTQSGFKVINTPVPKEVGEIALLYTNNVMHVSGNVYQQGDIETINNILSTQPWLSMDKEKDDKGKVRLIVNLKVVPTTLWIDIVFVALSKDNADSIGANSVPTISTAFSSFYDIVHGRGMDNIAQFGGNMNSTIRFLASNGVTRMYDAGTVVLRSGDPQGTTQHIGGTKYVKVSGSENGSLQNIEYGLKLTVKGGLISKDKVDLQFDLSNNGAITMAGGDSFDQSQEQVKSSMVCDLDSTVVLGGYKKIVQSTMKSGMPILRTFPVLEWFVSEDKDNNEELNLLILARPRIKNDSTVQKIVIPVIETVTPETEKAMQDNKKTIKEERQKRGQRRWFSW